MIDMGTDCHQHAETRHGHQDLSGDRLVAAARQVLTDAGEQWTEMRADVFGALADRKAPGSAYAVRQSLLEQIEQFNLAAAPSKQKQQRGYKADALKSR